MIVVVAHLQRIFNPLFFYILTFQGQLKDILCRYSATTILHTNAISDACGIDKRLLSDHISDHMIVLQNDNIM